MDSKFHPTSWTLVLSSKGESTEAKAALAELCETYYGPVMSFLRREGRIEDEAREATHRFLNPFFRRDWGTQTRNSGDSAAFSSAL